MSQLLSLLYNKFSWVLCLLNYERAAVPNNPQQLPSFILIGEKRHCLKAGFFLSNRRRSTHHLNNWPRISITRQWGLIRVTQGGDGTFARMQDFGQGRKVLLNPGHNSVEAVFCSCVALLGPVGFVIRVLVIIVVVHVIAPTPHTHCIVAWPVTPNRICFRLFAPLCMISKISWALRFPWLRPLGSPGRWRLPRA